MKKIETFSFDDLLKEAERRQAEFDALPLEEQRRRKAETAEILSKLRGTPGFTEVKIPRK